MLKISRGLVGEQHKNKNGHLRIFVQLLSDWITPWVEKKPEKIINEAVNYSRARNFDVVLGVHKRDGITGKEKGKGRIFGVK